MCRAGAGRTDDPDTLIDSPDRGIDGEFLGLGREAHWASAHLDLLGYTENKRVGGLKPNGHLGQLPSQTLMRHEGFSECMPTSTISNRLAQGGMQGRDAHSRHMNTSGVDRSHRGLQRSTWSRDERPLRNEML